MRRRSAGLPSHHSLRAGCWPWEREADDTEATASTFRSLMFAAVVPKALEKPLRVLCDELEGDHAENARERR